jgi:hypothetical protein
MTRITEFWVRSKVWLLSVLAGAILGCVFRLLLDNRFAQSRGDQPTLIMTLGFLVVVPLAMGYLAVHRYLRASAPQDVRWYKWLFLPWAAVMLMMLVAIAIKWEGLVCIIFAAPILLASALIGGLAARIVWGKLDKRAPGTLSAFALPLLLLLIETLVPSPYQVRTVNTEILIHAPAGVVWNNIKSVRAIAPAELTRSWVDRIGFPSPIAATLSHEGIGGVRQATFTGGLVFTETIDEWAPEQDLSFTIRANTQSIPRTTLDEHATIGGAFFDVLNGTYSLEQRPDGVLLHLSSRERLSTHFNPYAGLWTDAVMRAIQRQILTVVRNRCESAASAAQ